MKRLLSILFALSFALPASALIETNSAKIAEETIDGIQYEFLAEYELNYDTATAKLITVSPKPINEIEIPAAVLVRKGTKTYSFAIVEICEGAFADARGLTSVKFSSSADKPSPVEIIGDYAFSNCTALSSIELRYGLRYIGKRPFVNTAIPELTLPDTLLDMEGNIAAGAIYDMKLIISDSSHFAYSDDGVLYNRDMTKLYACPTRAEGTVIIPSSVTNICQDAFFGCFRLTYLNIPENVDVIGSDAFNVYGIWPDLIWLNRPPQESAPKLQYVFYEGSNEIAHAENDIYDHAPSSLTNFVFSENWNTNGWKNRPVVYIPPEDSNIPVPVLSYKDDNGITWFYRIIKGTAEIYNEEHGKSCAAIKPSSISGVLYTRSENDDTITSYGLRVPYSINGFAVTSIGSNAFENCSALVCIGLPASVQKIGDYAFKGCTALRAIDEYYNVPFFVTEGNISLPVGITEIGYHAFEDLNLTSISIPYTLTSTKGNPLAGLKHLTTVEVDSRNSKFTALGNVLYDKRRTTVIGVPVNYDESSISFPPSITTMGYEAMFGCANMVSISLPDSLEMISTNAFSSCSNVVSLTIPENVSYVDSKAFSDCVSLTNVTYQGCAATNAVDDIYERAQKVESTIFSDSPEIVAAWTNAAEGLTETTTTNETSHEITTLYTGEWKGRPINITLSSTTIPVNKEQHITIGNVTWYYHEVDGMAEIWREGNKTAVESDDPIMSLSLPSTLGGYIVKGIGDGALSDLRGITSISVPNTYEWIGDGAFSNCTSLASVSLGNGIEKIGHWPFFGTKITSLTIPDSVSEIDGNPVAGCSLMQAVVAADSQPNFSVADGLLYDKRKGTLYACPATKTAISLPESLKQINDDAFYGCNLNDDSYVIVDGVTWGFTSASDGGAKITSVQNADGTITIPASLAGRPVTEIEDGAFADCGEVKAFVSKSPAFKARNGVLYSADGKVLICVPNMMRLPYTVKTSTSTATIEEHSEAGVRGGLPYVDVTTTTNVSSTTTSTANFSGDITADALLAGVTHIRDYAFSGVNIFTNTYEAVTNGPAMGSAIPGDGKVNSYVISTSSDVRSVEYSTILTVNQATTTVAPNATADSGVEIVFSNKPRDTTATRPRVISTGGLPPPDAASVYDGFITDDAGDIAGTVQVKLAKQRNGKAAVTMTLQPANARKITVKGTLNANSSEVSGFDLSLAGVLMSGSYGGYAINGARNLSKSKREKESETANNAMKHWLGAVNVAWKDGTFTVTIAAKGKAKISGNLANGVKFSASSQAINFGDRLCIPIVVAKKASVKALLWLPINTGDEVVVEGLGDTSAGKPGTLRPGAVFLLDQAAAAKLTDDEAALPRGGITQSGTRWTVNDASGHAALKLRYTTKTGALKGSFKVYSEVNGRRKSASASATGVVIGNAAHGFATVKKAGSAPFEIR